MIKKSAIFTFDPSDKFNTVNFNFVQEPDKDYRVYIHPQQLNQTGNTVVSKLLFYFENKEINEIEDISSDENSNTENIFSLENGNTMANCIFQNDFNGLKLFVEKLHQKTRETKEFIIDALTMDKKSFEMIPFHYPDLKKLYIDSQENITDENLLYLKDLKELELTIDYCDNITGKSFSELKNLKGLNLSLMSHIEELPDLPENLQTLSLHDYNMNNKNLNENFSKIGNLKGLKNLYLVRCLRTSRFHEELKDLDKAFQKFGNLKNLEKLCLVGCEAITDDVLLSIVENIPSIKHLEIKRCKNVTKNGIKSIEREGLIIDYKD
jgi:hypothetical protein